MNVRSGTRQKSVARANLIETKPNDLEANFMKLKLIALLLALTVMSWAQSTTPAPAPAPDQKSTPADTKANCPGCDKMASADHKDMAACMHHGAAGKGDTETMSGCAGKDAKDAATCRSRKEGKSCSKDDRASAACCAGGKGGEGHEMACSSDKGWREGRP
jgi:hypothetical protein